jgi:hypothetical protein
VRLSPDLANDSQGRLLTPLFQISALRGSPEYYSAWATSKFAYPLVADGSKNDIYPWRLYGRVDLRLATGNDGG